MRGAGLDSTTATYRYPTPQQAVARAELARAAFDDASESPGRPAIKRRELVGVDFISNGDLFHQGNNRFGSPQRDDLLVAILSISKRLWLFHLKGFTNLDG